MADRMTPSPEDVERMIRELKAKAWASVRYKSGTGKKAEDHVCWKAADMLAALSAIGGGK